MLKRLRVQGFKSLLDCEVRLSSLATLFGLNASGKSNVLDALRLVSNIARCRTLKDAFASPYRGKPIESFAFGEGGLKELISKEVISLTIEVDLRLSDGIAKSVNREIQDVSYGGGAAALEGTGRRPARVRERDLRYRVMVEMLPASGVLRISDEYLAPLNDKENSAEEGEPFLERQGDKLILRPEGRAQTIHYNRYLDRAILSMPHHPPHLPHVVAARREFERWLFFYFEPRERMRAATPIKEVRQIGLMGDDLAGYYRTLQTLRPRQFQAVEKSLRMIMPEVEAIELGVNNLGEVEMRIRERGVSLPLRMLSEGTLRMLAILAAGGIRNEPAIVSIEEPENGIHPTRLELISELLQTRSSLGQTQYIVTTHSPALVDLLPIESLFAVRRDRRQTRIDPVSAWGPLAHLKEPCQLLADEHDRLPVSERILRGDFGA